MNKLIVAIAAAMIGAFISVGACGAEVSGSLAEKVKKFTPADVNIVAPADNVPKECAAFVGEWGPGLVPYLGSAVKVVVESVTPDCLARVVVVYAEPKSYGNDPGASSARHSVKIADRSFELKEVTPGSLWKLTLDGSSRQMDVNAMNTITLRSLVFTLLR